MGPIKTSIGPYRWTVIQVQLSHLNFKKYYRWVEQQSKIQGHAPTALPCFSHIVINWNPSHKPDTVLNLRWKSQREREREREREISNGGVILLKERKRGRQRNERGNSEDWARSAESVISICFGSILLINPIATSISLLLLFSVRLWIYSYVFLCQNSKDREKDASLSLFDP